MRRKRAPRRAFTLLEVILALAILGLALATLGEAVGRSHQNARRAADEAELCFAAASLLDEVIVGARQLVAIDSEPIADALDPTAPPVALVSLRIENGPLEGVLVLYATEHLHMGAIGYGALTTASAAGGLLATATFGWLERHVSFATLMRVVLSLEVLMHLSFALTTVGWVALVIMFGFGAYAFVWGTISTTVRQRLVPHELQGRVSSVNMVGVFGGMVIGQALGGVIADRAGIDIGLFVAGGVTLVGALMFLIAGPPRSVPVPAVPEATPPEPEPDTEGA